MAATVLARLTPGYQPDELYCKQKEIFENTMKLLAKQSKNKLVHIIMQFIGQNSDMVLILEDELF